MGASGSGECAFNAQVMSHMCERLGVPLAPEKCEGPTTCLTFLGIEIDTVALELRLPAQKLVHLRRLVRKWLSDKAHHTKKELESLTRQLQHAATVVRPRRTFLRRMYDLLSATKHPHHHIPMRNTLRSDLAWWDTFLSSWNGTSMMRQQRLSTPDTVVVSDASGRWGCGALWGAQWQGHMEGVSIVYKELIPVILAAAIWRKHWMGAVIQCRSNNQATVAAINNRIKPRCSHDALASLPVLF